MNGSIVWSVARATFREFWRTPEAVFWTYGFPVLMAVVLGMVFKPKEPDPVPVAVVAGATAPDLQQALAHDPRLQLRELASEAADNELARGRIAIMVSGTGRAPVLRLDPTRPESELARLVVLRALRTAVDGAGAVVPQVEAENRPGARYIDFLIPGLIGLNLLGAGMWGVGFNLVQMRTQHLLRRLLVTPMRRSEFLLGFLFSRLVLMLPESVAIWGFGALLWGVPFRGSWLAVALLVLVGGMCFCGLGILIAARPKTVEGVGGLMNLVLLPMWLLGGSFFDNERVTGVLGWAVEAMPLTHLNRGLRDCMLGAGGFEVAWAPLLVLGAIGVMTFALAIRLFRWT